MSRTSKKETLNELESKINTLERSNFDLKLRLHYLNTKYGHLENNDSRHGGYAEFDLRDEIQTLTEENGYYKQKIVELETEILRLQVAREKDQEKYQEALRMKPAAAQQVEEQRKREREVPLAIAEHDAALIAKLQEELQQLHTERAGHQMTVSDLNDKISKLVRLADDKDEEIDSLVKTVRDMRFTIDNLNQEQQKIANLAEAATRPIVVTTNTTGQQTSVTLNAAGTNVNASAMNNNASLAATQRTIPLLSQSAYHSQFQPSMAAPMTTSQPQAQSIAVTQQAGTGGSTAVSVTATPGRPSSTFSRNNNNNTTVLVSNGNGNTNLNVSSSLNNNASMDARSVPLGVYRGTSTTAGLQHSLQHSTTQPTSSQYQSQIPYPPPPGTEDMMQQSLHASMLNNNSTILYNNNSYNPVDVSYSAPPQAPPSVTFSSVLPDGSPVRTTVMTSTSNNPYGVASIAPATQTQVNVSTTTNQPIAANPNQSVFSMQQQFQQSMQQASYEIPSAVNTTTVTTQPPVVVAPQPFDSNVSVTTTGDNVNTIHIQQRQQPPAASVLPPPVGHSQYDILQQSILTTEQVIQRLRQNAQELSLLDRDEVQRLEQELHKTQVEKDKILSSSTAAAPTVTAAKSSAVPLNNKPLNETLYELPPSSPLRTSLLANPTPAHHTYSTINRGVPPTATPVEVRHSTTSFVPPSSTIAQPPATTTTTSVSFFSSPAPVTNNTYGARPLTYSNATPGGLASGSSHYLHNANGNTSLAAASAAVNAHPHHQHLNHSLSSHYPGVARYTSSLNNSHISSNESPYKRSYTDQTPMANNRADTSVYERTIDLYKLRENELLSALEGVVKRVQELEEIEDPPVSSSSARNMKRPLTSQHQPRHHHHQSSYTDDHQEYDRDSESEYSHDRNGHHHHHHHAPPPSTSHHRHHSSTHRDHERDSHHHHLPPPPRSSTRDKDRHHSSGSSSHRVSSATASRATTHHRR